MNAHQVNKASVSNSFPNRISSCLPFIATALLSLSAVAVGNDNIKAATPRSVQDCTNCPTLEMVKLPRGKFMMGDDKSLNTDAKPAHEVMVDYDFEIGKYEVTQAQWQAVMGKNPSVFKQCGSTCPVENVSWDDVQIFISKLNQLTNKQYRLPTEAEWEYACRAGMGYRYKYCGSNKIHKVAWHAKTQTHPVGKKTANAWGLYDMSGNVNEWVQDIRHSSYLGAPSDARQAWEDVKDENPWVRVFRGGSWDNYLYFNRAAFRAMDFADYGSLYIGFRLARTMSS